jgi:hypothetical protein
MTADFNGLELPALGAIIAEPRHAVSDDHAILRGVHMAASDALLAELHGMSILADNHRAPSRRGPAFP